MKSAAGFNTFLARGQTSQRGCFSRRPQQQTPYNGHLGYENNSGQFSFSAAVAQQERCSSSLKGRKLPITSVKYSQLTSTNPLFFWQKLLFLPFFPLRSHPYMLHWLSLHFTLSSSLSRTCCCSLCFPSPSTNVISCSSGSLNPCDTYFNGTASLWCHHFASGRE